MAREIWGSRLGFMLAAIGSAVGLANIVRFPYLVGHYGGSAFIVIYLIALFLIGFPVLLCEILIGRATHQNPACAYRHLGGKAWQGAGFSVVLTGFLVSGFYSVLAGWILGYLYAACTGQLQSLAHIDTATVFFQAKVASPGWALGWHSLFMGLCFITLIGGVKRGLERASKILLPLMLTILLCLVWQGLQLEGAQAALTFLLSPNWQQVTPTVVLIALGQAFFTISAGQGTMITYGSYLSRQENLLQSCWPILVADTLISLLAAIAVFSIVFSTQLAPEAGIGLIFQTIPVVLTQVPGGPVLGIAFFGLVLVAALTSEISALEPSIAWLGDRFKWSRAKSVTIVCIGALLLGIPSALSYSVLQTVTLGGKVWLEFFDALATRVLIPVGGLCSVVLVGWRWGLDAALTEISASSGRMLLKWQAGYLKLAIRYLAPVTILVLALFGQELG